MLTLEQLLGPYSREPWTPDELAAGERTCAAWNLLLPHYEAGGGVLVVNPATGTLIGGTGNGGARPKGSKVGAAKSKHQYLLALDLYDPRRDFMRWLLAYGVEHAMGLGMYFEHPQWTRSWVHGQIVAPGDEFTRWGVFFCPYVDMVKNPVTCAALPGQSSANVQEFSFNPT